MKNLLALGFKPETFWLASLSLQPHLQYRLRPPPGPHNWALPSCQLSWVPRVCSSSKSRRTWLCSQLHATGVATYSYAFIQFNQPTRKLCLTVIVKSPHQSKDHGKKRTQPEIFLADLRPVFFSWFWSPIKPWLWTHPPKATSLATHLVFKLFLSQQQINFSPDLWSVVSRLGNTPVLVGL